MASPQRPLPKEPRHDAPPQLEDLGRAQREVSSGWRFGFWWVWILIIVGIWFVGFGWGSSGGWIRGHGHAVQTTNDTALAGPDVAVLDAANKLPYVGQSFMVQNAPVEREAGPRAYWIGSRLNSNPMLVVNDSNPANTTANAAPVNHPPNAAANAAESPNHSANHRGAATAIPQASPHEWLDVTGRIVKAPAAAQAERQWGLSTADASQLENAGVYVQATEMQTVAH